MKELTKVDKEGWKAELPLIHEHFATFGAKLPKASRTSSPRWRSASASARFGNSPLPDGERSRFAALGERG